MSAETRKDNWLKLWPGLAVSTRVSEKEAGEAAVWLGGRVAELPEETRAETLLELLRMTGLTASG